MESAIAGVRLQLDRAGQRSSYSQSQEVNEADVLSSAPNLTIGSNRVRLDGMRYRITLDLPARKSGTGRALPATSLLRPLPGARCRRWTIRGAGGWVSGYVVPVMSGRLTGTAHGRRNAGRVFDDGAGYHDHNWGFWKDVSWRWGQVHHGDLSLVYGRIHPPADAADAERIPGFLAAIGPDGPVGYATNVSIEETNDPATGHPRSITVTGRSSSLDVAMELDRRRCDRDKEGRRLRSAASWIFFSFGRVIAFAAAQETARSTSPLLERQRRFGGDDERQYAQVGGTRQ